MNGFSFKLGRFIFLRWLLGFALLVGLVYLEEDWRGASEWAATKAEWEAKGESFDRTKFIPPPVPDEQNLAALPLFKLSPVTTGSGQTYLSLEGLRQAMRYEPPANEIPDLGKWSLGELPNMPKIRTAIASNYAILLKGTKAPESALAQFDAIYPFLAELRTASATRSFFRLDLDYAIDPPYQRSLGPVVDSIRVSKLLTLQAVLALDEHQSDLAIADLKLSQQLLAGAERDPSLVGGLVAIGIRSITNVVIYNGLCEHLWTDAQLAEIEGMLKPIDFLVVYQFAMRGEVIYSLGTIDYLRQPGHLTAHDKLELQGEGANLRTLFADGWWDDNKRQIATHYFHGLAAVDPQARRVFPDVALKLKREADRASEGWTAQAPWNLFFSMLGPGTSMSVEKFAEGQVSVDETRIACALERSRLAHGVYPATLAALAPAYLEEIPHDIMNGEPYRYRLKVDGTFLLYSVGWNQKDDGGTIAFKPDEPKTIDYENGDWVWPTAGVVH